MNKQITKTEAEIAILAQFEEARAALPGAGIDWLNKLRGDAIEVFHRNGLPHRRLEDWKYTDLRTVISEALPHATDGSVDATGSDLFGALKRHVAVFVNGRFRPDLSSISDLPEGAEFLSLDDAVASAPEWFTENLGQSNADGDNAVLALNTAFMGGGGVLRIAEGVEVEHPIEFSFIYSGSERSTVATRNLVILEKGARATLLETFSNASDAGHVTNVVGEFMIADDARLDHVKVQLENVATTHLSTLAVRLEARSVLNTFTATAGSGVTRNEIAVKVNGEGTKANMSGGYMLSGKQHCDTTLQIDHAVPGCDSTELFKGVIDDDAHGVFQGKIIVRPDAQQTDARMMTQGLLLSEHAQFTTKPELEIFADDVQCAHGATSGDLDEESLFYLRSRGIPEPEAKALLIAAFIAEAFDQIENEAVREVLNGLPARWLEQTRTQHDA